MPPNYSQQSDEELLRLSLKQPVAFNVLLERYQDKLYRKARQILRSDDDAKDAVQEAFVSIYLHAGRFQAKSTASFSSWAYAVITNKCFTAYKRNQAIAARLVPLSPELEALLAGSDERFEHENKDLVATLLALLPPRLRRTLDQITSGYSYEEIAMSENITAATARSRVHRAKKLLRSAAEELKIFC